jgi:hypothetical protein
MDSNIILLNEFHKHQFEKIRIANSFRSDYRSISGTKLNVWQSQSTNFRLGYRTIQNESMHLQPKRKKSSQLTSVKLKEKKP